MKSQSFEAVLRTSGRGGGGHLVDIPAEVVAALMGRGRTPVPIPTELAAAFRRNPAAREAWDRLSFTHRKEHARAIEEAKRPETRARRVQKALELLARKA